MRNSGNHCSFVLLAEFHIFEGAQLKYQFPQPLGIDEGVLAMSMLPDGAETQLDDWTIFFLNQTPFNTISPILALDTPEVKAGGLPGDQDDISSGNKPDLLCVLNLVRTKHDKTLDRGAKVLALAICTRHPFIQIFKPFLLMALDDYFSDPSQDCLARLFDAVNSMDLSAAPMLTRQEKMVMRFSERKDIFAEKFSHFAPLDSQLAWNGSNPGFGAKSTPQHRSTNSGESYSSFEEGLLLRQRDKDRYHDDHRTRERESAPRSVRTETESTMTGMAVVLPNDGQNSPSDSSFSLGGSAVWVGDESGLDITHKDGKGDASSVLSSGGSNTMTSRRRRSTDASSSSSQTQSKDQMLKVPANTMHTYHDSALRSGVTKDTHFFQTSVAYKDHRLPIKMPMSTFPEEVGDYSLITLIKEFSSHQLVSGPQHPHLHTNGPQTHPIIILFNALVTGKRIIFLGHKRPAGEVSAFVLSACALGSGCGAVLRGFVERAFPYANLNNRDEWEAVPAYIAGVTNPIFLSSRAWDLLLVIGGGTVTVAKDIHVTYPVSGNPTSGPALLTRTGTVKAESSFGSEDDAGRAVGGKEGAKSEFVTKTDNNADKIFIEDIRSAIDDHFGENMVRMRFTEYVTRFVRLASRYEEEITGTTKIGFPSSSFTELPGRLAQLGSGIVFNDEASCLRELSANAQRIEAWRKTNSYQYCVMDFAKLQASSTIKGFDVLHQLIRLRHTKNMSDSEVSAIMRTLAENGKSYEQVVELLAYLPHGGGLLHLSFGLFHQKEAVRNSTVDLFNQLRVYPVGVLFLQALNHFQRYAYVRQAHLREKRLLSEQQQQLQSQAQSQSQAQPQPQLRNHSTGGVSHDGT